jgi:hypothetical protein
MNAFRKAQKMGRSNGVAPLIILSYAFDWVLLAVGAGVGYVLGEITPNKRPFSLDEHSIAYVPYNQRPSLRHNIPDSQPNISAASPTSRTTQSLAGSCYSAALSSQFSLSPSSHWRLPQQDLKPGEQGSPSSGNTKRGNSTPAGLDLRSLLSPHRSSPTG